MDGSSSPVVVVTNLGVQDVRVLDETSPEADYLPIAGKRVEPAFTESLGTSESTLRSTCLALMDRLRMNYDVTRPILRFPLLQPALRRISEQVGGHIDRIVLIATNQPEGIPHRRNDTIELARVVTLILRRERPETTVDIVELHSSPHLLEQVRGQLTEKLSELVPRQPETRIFLSMSAGIPAVNYALLWHALQHLGANTVFYQIVEPPVEELCRGEENAEVELFPVTGFLTERVVQSLADFLDRRDYAGARTLFRRFVGCFPRQQRSQILDLLRAAEFQLALDFKSSAECARRAISRPELRDLAYRFSLEGLSEIDQDLRRLTSLVELIGAQLREERYTDALWRVLYFTEYVDGLFDELYPQLSDGERHSLAEIRNDCHKLKRLSPLRNAKVHPRAVDGRLYPERNQGISGADFDAYLADERLLPARQHLAPFLLSMLRRLADLTGAKGFEVDYHSLNCEILELLRDQRPQ